MFKDLYKKANDKIPTEDAYLRVMDKVEAKSKKTKYSYAKVALLAACFLLTVSMISVYENFAPKEEVPFEVLTPETLTTDAPKVSKSVPTPETTPAVVVEEKVEQAELCGYPTVSPEVAEEVTFENSFFKNQGIPENIGTNVARFTLGDTVLKETYYEYLGKNVEESLALPEGFINETPDEHKLCLEENENFDDRWTFYFTKGENSIFITTTKKTENILSVLNSETYEKSTVSGITAVWFEQDLEKIALIEVGGIAYTLSSYGVSDQDFENLIISLTK